MKFSVMSLMLLMAVGLTSCSLSKETVLVQGSVKDTQGHVPEFCTLGVQTIFGGPAPELAQILGERGEFSWVLPPGRYRFEAHCDSLTGFIEAGSWVSESVEVSIVVTESD